MAEIPSSEITDKRFYLNRRAFIASALAAAGASAIVNPELHAQQPAPHGRKLATVKSPLSGSDSPNTWEHATTYNNFYEFGTGKSDPALNARGFKPRAPWTIADRRRVREARHHHPGRRAQGADARGSRLPPPVCRRLVDGDPVGRVSARLTDQALRADVESRLRRVHDAARPPSDAGAGDRRAPVACTSRGCAWTKRCTR